MNQHLHAYKKSNQRRYHKLRDENYSSMVIRTPTKDRRSRRSLSNDNRGAGSNACFDPMASTPMCSRELYSGRNEQPSRIQTEDREMIESPPPVRDYTKRENFGISEHDSSFYYGQVEQRDCPEYSTFQNQSTDSNAFFDPMTSTPMCSSSRELYSGRNERPSHIQAGDREMIESPPSLRDYTKRKNFGSSQHESSLHYGQVEQRDCPEHSTFQNHSNYRPREEQISYEDFTSSLRDTNHENSATGNTIISPPRLRHASLSYASTQDSQQHALRNERGCSRKQKGESRSFPMQTRHYSINEVRSQAHRPLVPLYGYRNVGHPSLGIIRLRLPDRYLSLLDQIVDGCERHAATLPNGWKTDLYSLTKQDIALVEAPRLYELARPIKSYLKAAASQLYGIGSMKTDRNQPHVVKYTHAHRGVEMHHDKSDITMNVMLSRSRHYRGGGTFFPGANENVRLEFGEFLLHPGDAVHGGTPITGGTRYLMVIFANKIA